GGGHGARDAAAGNMGPRQIGELAMTPPSISGTAPGLAVVLVIAGLFIVVVAAWCKSIPEDTELPAEPRITVADIQYRLDHGAPREPIGDARQAHAITQEHINCDEATCARKRAAITFLVAAGKWRRDSGRI
ncbi:hypothetical protein, partial [Nocardia transvalensis]|uniref:hypothetical protein n=1 Tax=Nocardia transvalensis TaxID=37333 RepID=UPI001C3F1A41